METYKSENTILKNKNNRGSLCHLKRRQFYTKIKMARCDHIKDRTKTKVFTQSLNFSLGFTIIYQTVTSFVTFISLCLAACAMKYICQHFTMRITGLTSYLPFCPYLHTVHFHYNTFVVVQFNQHISFKKTLILMNLFFLVP